VAPLPVVGLLPSAQMNEGMLLVVFGLVPLVRAVFVGVPSVIVLVAFVVIALVVLALLVFFFPVVLRASSSHHRNRCSKDGSQKNGAEPSVSTLQVVLLSARFKFTNPTHITFYLCRSSV
jgi:uncharacterized membrane protein YuzA (DUF378 family)